MKVFLYARKSTDDSSHQVLSIDTQLHELRALARQHGLTIVEEITETRTARIPGRPAFNAMLDRLAQGEAEGLLCWKLHRLARNLDDGGKVITLLKSERIKAIHTLEKVHHPNENVILLALEFGMAAQSSYELSKDVKLGLASKFRQGGWPSTAPTGYVNDRVRKTIVVHPAQASLVRQAFEMYATGRHSLSWVLAHQTAAGLRTNNGKPLSRSNMEAILRNPFYYGLMRYRGELNRGVHEPIVTKALFDKVQALLSRRHRPRQGKDMKPFLYRGLLRCGECGGTVTLDVQKGHRYLRCTKRVRACASRYVREELVDEQVDALLARLRIPPTIPETILHIMAEDEELLRAEKKQRIQGLRTQIEAAIREKDALLDLLLRRLLDEPEYLRAKNQLVEKLAELHETLRSEEVRSDPFEPLREFVQGLKEAVSLTSGGSREQKLEFLKKIGSNFTLQTGDLRVVLQNRWQIWMEWVAALPSPWHEIPKGYQRSILCPVLEVARTGSRSV